MTYAVCRLSGCTGGGRHQRLSGLFVFPGFAFVCMCKDTQGKEGSTGLVCQKSPSAGVTGSEMA